MGGVGGSQAVVGWRHPCAVTPVVDVCRDIPVAARAMLAEAHLIRKAEGSLHCQRIDGVNKAYVGSTASYVVTFMLRKTVYAAPDPNNVNLP